MNDMQGPIRKGDIQVWLGDDSSQNALYIHKWNCPKSKFKRWGLKDYIVIFFPSWRENGTLRLIGLRKIRPLKVPFQGYTRQEIIHWSFLQAGQGAPGMWLYCCHPCWDGWEFSVMQLLQSLSHSCKQPQDRLGWDPFISLYWWPISANRCLFMFPQEK